MQLVLNKKLRKALKKYKFEKQKEINKIKFDFVYKLTYNGKGWLNDPNVFQKLKLTKDDLYYFMTR